ncbi:hypothetical protein ABZX85_25315 [Streptomyces sp. NPDC004539]|uniref:hypothetical protein n=1 Tax=Streptomyces sp. NPDC004539 TaxID=3154280 RepID=UPI0033A4A5DF
MDNKARSTRTAGVGVTALALGAMLTVLGPHPAGATTQQPAVPSVTGPRTVAPAPAMAGPDDTAVLGQDTRSLDGLQITPSAPRPWTPADTSAGSDRFNYLVTVKFTNNSNKNIDLSDVMTEANTDGGATHTINDSANDVGMSLDAGRLAPQQTSTLKYGFSTESKPSYVNFDFKMFLGDDTAQFTYTWR